MARERLVLILGSISVPAAFLFGIGALVGAASIVLAVPSLRGAVAGRARTEALAGASLGAIAVALVVLYLTGVAGS